jgi:spermidine synthase
MRVVNGKRRVLQAVVRLDARTGRAMAEAVISEYLRTMAAVTLAALEPPAAAESRSETVPYRNELRPMLRCLHIGLGAAALPRLLAHCEPRSTHEVVEIDAAVVTAAAEHCGGEFVLAPTAAGSYSQTENCAAVGETATDPGRPGGGGSGAAAATDATGDTGMARDAMRRSAIRVHLADGALWVAAQAERPAHARPTFDACLIDCFDNDNACPPALLSALFLENLKALLSEDSVVVLNQHFGSRKLKPRLARAERIFADTFGAALRVDSLDSKLWAGNAILCGALAVDSALASPALLEARARRAQERLGIAYDLPARVRPKG